jgi:toxin-antitoxin system PIN domain toxin
MILLPDVNVLVALMWERHIHHAAARHWFAHLEGDVVATCSVTQTGFVRVSSNPKVLDDAITVREATAILSALVNREDHRFLPDERGYIDNPLVPHDRLVGHRQVTDAHLIAIARAHDARVVSFDQGFAALGGSSVQALPIG